MKIGILTGGGDCPGLNAVIRAVVRKAASFGYETVGIRDGWRGMVEAHTQPLDINSVSGILPKGGTILGTSRTNPYKEEDGEQEIIKNMKNLAIDTLIAVGGEDTLGVASKVHKAGVKIVGVPKTIDNDISGTDFTFGFDTAVNIATEAIDRIHTTAESHNRVMVVEVMGRHTGWIALYAGLAGGADVILIPEKPFDLDNVADVIKTMEELHRITRPGGTIFLVTPHYTDFSSFRDPTHRWHLNTYSFLYFYPGGMHGRDMWYTKVRFREKHLRVKLLKLWKLLGFEFFVNHAKWFRRFWEHYLSFLIRGKVMEFTFEVLK